LSHHWPSPGPHSGAHLTAATLARLRDSLKDSYLVERELGEGGAATVYLARDIKHERNVAIKVFKPELAETLGAERFSREIRTAANLQHPHILTVHDSGVADGLLYYVMPYVEGESLRARITREGGLPIGDVIRILREVADALGTAHAAGVVHRDIKPDNVLLSGRHALVADFGVAKAISESTGRNLVTTIGVALGTPAYMAPEQAAADPHVDHRADIYAIGVLGYEMLTGEPPFVRRTPQEVLAAHVTEPAPAVSVRRQSVPPALDALIAKCLLKQPGDRYQSAEDVVSELERIATPSGGMSPTAGMSPAAGMVPTGAAAAAAMGRSRFTRAGPAIAVAALVLVAGWFAVAKLRGTRATDPNVVLVLPFEFSGAPALAYLREGIVNVLETNLTGEAGPRAIASQTAIAQWKRKGGADRGLTEEEARAVARELGAGQLLRGSIVAAGTDLVVSASLTMSRAGGSTIQAQVKGPADSIASLATQLAGQVLSLRVGEAAERLHSLQMVPPAALRQYLVGRQALRESRFADAYNAFAAALAQDSTFALAGMGLSLAQSWSQVSLGAGDGNAIAFNHRDHLGPRDLVLLEMTIPTRFAGHPMTLREITDVHERLVQQIPDRPEGWYLIGDNYFHRGAVMGLTVDEAIRRAMFAFQKVLALDPGVTYVQGHVAQSPWASGQYERARQLAESLHAPVPEVTIGARVRMGDTADFASYRAELARLNRDQLVMLSVFVSGTSVADSAIAMALARSTDAAQRENLMLVDRTRLMWEGRPAAAREAGARLTQIAKSPGAQYAHAVVYDAAFASGDTIAGTAAAALVAGSLRPAAAALARPSFEQRAPLFLMGLWASYRNDASTLASVTQRLDAMAARKDSVYPAAAARLAFDVLRLLTPGGATDRALVARLDSIMRDGPPFTSIDMRAAMNLIVARSWERLGDARHAAAAAERTSSWEGGGSLPATAGFRETGRLKLAAGDTTGAIWFWSAYLENRGRAEPSQRKLDDEIRAKLAEIERKKR
jgi:serine/threonine-protein kinase